VSAAVFGRKQKWVKRDMVAVWFPGDRIPELIYDRTTSEVQAMRPGWHTFEVSESCGYEINHVYGRRTKRLNLAVASIMEKRTCLVEAENVNGRVQTTD
jgi:hypothetical protein